MYMNKRQFIKDMVLTSIATPLGLAGIAQSFKEKENVPAMVLAKDDAFWLTIRNQYLLKPDYINLENGYYNFIPQPLLEKFIQHIREVNYQGSYYMRTVQWDNKNKIAARLAEIGGCLPEEMIITRNATESLDLVIGGFDWTAGDEAVMAVQDYGSILDMFEQVKNRYGVITKKVSLPLHPKNDEEIVNLYASVITEKTKVMMISHMVNITGQILPVRKICDMAHSKGVQVIVDGAHSFAHSTYRIDELNCDYYATSLHKWLSSPLGAGFLYINKNNIKKLWPLLADGEKDINKINRLNHIGTHPVHTDLTINDCIDYYKMIGAERKEARMYFLQNYWTSKVRNLPRVSIYIL